MNEFLKVLLNIRSLRAALRELSLEQLKEAHEKIETIYLERLEVAEKVQAANAERQQKLAEFQAMLFTLANLFRVDQMIRAWDSCAQKSR